MSEAKRITDADIAEAKSLDWKANPEHFDKFCEFVITLFSERDGLTREGLFSLLPEPEFRRAVQKAMDRRDYHGMLTAGYAYMHIRFGALADAVRRRKASS